MKKLLSIFALLFCMFFICSCVSDNENAKVQNVMNQNFSEVDFKNVTTDLELLYEIDGVKITYVSSNEQVLTSDGKVFPQEEDVVVYLTATYQYNDYSKKVVYEITVLSQSASTISALKKATTTKKVSIKGIVAKIINGTEKNVPVAFYLVDETDGIYVYASQLETMPEVGDEVVVNGKYGLYLSETEQSSAEMVGYEGSKQITLETLEIVSKGNTLAYDFAKVSSISELAKIDVKENITSNLYQVKAKIRKVQGNGFVNYYFDDLNGVNSYYAYTTANGKDLGWLEEYDGTIRTCLIMVINAKISASGSFWRIIPIEIGEEVVVSDEEYINYALDRTVSQFQEKYQTSCEFNLRASDEILHASIEYTTVSNGCTIVKNENDYTIQIAFTTPCTMEVEVAITYNEKTMKRVVTFECVEEKPVVELTTIRDARNLEKGDNVNIAGVIAGFLYLKGTTKPAGFELLDETSSIAVFVSTSVDTKTDITKLSVGEYVIVNGNYDLYQPREDNNHKGSIRLNNAEVLYHDYQTHELYEGVIETVDFSTLYNNPSDNNITNKAYYSTFYIEKSSGSYANYYIHDLVNPENSMIVYSQNSSSTGPGEYSWLAPYVGKCVKGLVTLRIGAVSSGEFIWKAGILSVEEVVHTPILVKEYFIKKEIQSLFAKEYASSASITYTEDEEIYVNFSSPSNQVECSKVENVHTIMIKEPVLTEETIIEVTLTSETHIETFQISIQITRPAVLTLAEFRELATKNGENVIVEGIVSCLVKAAGDTSWTFFITDETGTVFCKTKKDVNVGDKVRIQGNMDLYYGLPQIASNATITILSSNNEVSEKSFHKDATIADLVNNNTAGEAGKCGAEVYTHVQATIHVSSSRVYITVENQEIDLYNYTNAKYYEENYQPLEKLDGQTILLDLVAYNWYKTQYTYVIVSYTTL